MNNNSNETPTKGKKGASVGLVICFVAAVAMVGTYTFKNYKNSVADEMAKSQAKLEQELARAEESKTTNTTNVIQEQQQENAGEKKDAEDTSLENDSTDGTAQDHATENNAIKEEPDVQTENTKSTSGTAAQLSYSEATEMFWPVDGNVIMNYSMDQTVYFATLDQYKYNPAMIIAGDAGSQVVASARGIVKSIEEKVDTGLTMTLDIGSGYELVYGQLKDLQFQEGSLVEAGEMIGYVQQPSRYYTVEGCNLYFQVLKDGVAVDPLDYLEA